MNALKWDQKCRTDHVRNQSIIPILSNVIKPRSDCHILDAGCGSGYISREIARDSLNNNHTFYLLDVNQEMLDLAKKMWPENQKAIFLYADFLNPKTIPILRKFDIIFSAYLLLEIPEIDEFVNSTVQLLTENGKVLLFIPDFLEDIEKLDLGSTHPHIALHEYIKGKTELKKVNSFTDTELPFIAHRIEYILASFLSKNLILTEFKKFCSVDNKVHFSLIFDKRLPTDV